MNRTKSVLAFLLVFLLTGCQPNSGGTNPSTKIDPEKYKKQAKDAGEIAALTYLVAAKPTPDQVKAIKGTIDILNQALKNWKGEGFAGVLPIVNAEIDKLLPPDTKKAENLLARKLASTLVDELDNQFKKHPEWKDKAVPYVDLVSAFCDGASEGFGDFKNNKLEKLNAPK